MSRRLGLYIQPGDVIATVASPLTVATIEVTGNDERWGNCYTARNVEGRCVSFYEHESVRLEAKTVADR